MPGRHIRTRVETQLKERYTRMTPFLQADVQILTLLSTPTSTDLHYELCCATIWTHPFLKVLHLLDTPLVMKATRDAVDLLYVKADFGGKSMEALMSPINLSGAEIFCHCFTFVLHCF